jgi:hypothetical protein
VDEDGDIIRWLWDFGDGETSWNESPWHTYETPGRYLVSCTVRDNDSVQVTDWQYVRVPRGNLDGDGDVDLDDYTGLYDCITGPQRRTLGRECEIFDFDGDHAVDLFDVKEFQATFTGPTP